MVFLNRSLECNIPVIYILKCLEPALQNGGCTAFIHFDAKSPPGWKSGALYVQGETKKLRNPEGEAIAQWSDADLNFTDEKAMIGSNGQVVLLSAKDRSGPPKVLNCEPLNTHFKSRRDCKIGILGGDFALYEFRMSFGDVTWMISKRYSEFDALDNVLNTKYGLPPVGLPPKQWFGLRDPNVIQSRHDGFNLYLNDCIKRPVLVLSPELQSFCEMPEEVINSFKKN
uniref:PX domain-containing protein n=1 Tax=Guillardia theta TaxID=55529 RepID=A0A7S4ULN7_GUITH|mmetsp:Transcript_9196/g.30657  ORF Transcript_9196/g.30657 Transcript_9196/m.30657 type:complete len:227 (+) Transcript_9196:45-725(+)